jgi:deoxyadenosine/deoxycytidine kinase
MTPTVMHIVLEGNIGVGKSTLLSGIYEHFGIESGISFAWEPVVEWQKQGFLRSMYTNEISHSEFQYMVFCSLLTTTLMRLSEKPRVLIQERSIHSAFEVFAKANVQPGESFDMLEFSYNEIKKTLYNVNTHIIYLRVPASVAYARVSKRARASEGSVSQEYINTINTRYEEWLCCGHSENTTIIDAAQDIESVSKQVIQTITRLLKQTGNKERVIPKELFPPCTS